MSTSTIGCLSSYRSQIFFYSSGVSVGMVASMLILVFVLSKLLPKVRVAVGLCFSPLTHLAAIL